MAIVTLYQNHLMEINYDAEKALMITSRTRETELMSEDEYRRDILVWSRLIQEHKPFRQLVDDREMIFAIPPNLQEWVNINLIVPAIRSGVKYVAFLVSDDVFTRVSIEQTMDEQPAIPLDVKYFEQEDKAMRWLLE